MEQKITAPTRASRQTYGLAFFKGFLHNPEAVGSVIPSSRFLEQRVITAAGIQHAQMVVEFGPGTGGTTRAILKAMPASARLLTIEVNPDFTELLNTIDDPRLINQVGSALDLQSILTEHRLPAPDVIVSGIPFSTMPAAIGSGILQAAWTALAPTGRFVAYQFRNQVAQLARNIMGEPAVAMELRNAPPMRIYRWQKPVNGHP